MSPNFGKLAITTKKGQLMTYKLNLETFGGTVKTISLPSKGAVAQFINTYPAQLPVGVSVKIACDTLGIRGTLRGTLTPSNSN
jgi:hypothetical protein